MLKHIFRKFSVLSLSLLIVVTATFFLMHLLPGDPFTEEELIPPEVLSSLYSYYHLDKPLMEQFLIYIKNILSGNLGPSLKYAGRSVNDIIKQGFPISFCLGLEALVLATVGGIFLGSIAAIYKEKKQDLLVTILSVLGISIPSFILASFLQYLFAMQLNLFPIARWGGVAHTILPAFSLAALPLSFIARLTRASMVEVLEQDYILTAKAKGASTTQIIFNHVLRNALLPVLSYIGPLTASILTGSFVIEKIFGIPGLGQSFVLSVMNRDYTLILSLTLFYSGFLMVCVYIVDILYYIVDPRIRKSHE